MPSHHDLAEDLVFQCLEVLGSRGPEAIDEILAGHADEVVAEARRMLATLTRVGLAGGEAQTDAPERLGPYRLLERIGAGTMGVVYRAQRAGAAGIDGDGPELALKLLQPGLLPVRGSRVRFQREIAALRGLEHPGICPILDDGEAEGVPFLAMPLVPGQSLREILAGGPAGVDADRRARLLQIVQLVALALHHAHERGFVHRDVKPANVLVRPDGQPVLLDFGLARLEQPGGGAAQTLSGGVVGTPAYMAPEQVAGRPDVDRRCDVYALGAVLYEGLTGRLPHEAPTRESLYRRILAGEIARPSRLLRQLPADLDVVCLTALERDPGRRYQTAQDFAADLERVSKGTTPVARLPGPLLRTRRWIARNPLPSSLLFVVSLALVGVMLLLADLRRWSRDHVARAGAADAMAVLAADPDVALHLAIRANELAPSMPVTLTVIQTVLGAERDEFTLDGHQDAVRTLEFAADGQRLVSASMDGTARIWDPAADASLDLRHGSVGVAVATFSPDGHLVATASCRDGRICVWNARNGERLWEKEAHASGAPVRVLRWSPDGRFLLSGGGDRSARIWTVPGELRGELPIEAGSVHAGVWLDTQTVVTGSGPSADEATPVTGWSVRVWRLPAGSGAALRVAELPFRAGIVSVDPHPVRRDRALVTAREPVVHLCDLVRGQVLQTLDAELAANVAGAGWSPDGSHAFTVAAGGRIEIWTADGQPLNPGGQRAGPDRVTLAVANPRLPWFALCGDLGNVLLVDYERRFVREFGGRRLRGAPVALSPDGERLAVTTAEHAIQVWRVRAWDPELPVFDAGGDRVLAVSWADEGREVVTGTGKQINQAAMTGTLGVWDAATGRLVGVEPQDLQVLGLFPDRTGERMIVSHGRGLKGQVRVLRRGREGWRPDGDPLPAAELEEYAYDAQFVGDDRVLVCDAAGRALIWDLGSRQVLHRLPAAVSRADPESVYRRWFAACAAPDGSVVWAGGVPGLLHRFDRGADGAYQEAAPQRIGTAIRALALLPDGSLMVGGWNGLLQRLRTDGATVHFHGHRDGVMDIDWTRLDNEVLVVTGDRGGVVRLWRVDGTPLRQIAVHRQNVWSVRFSPDGTRLLSGSADGTARIWPVRTSDLLALARQRVRPLTPEQQQQLGTRGDR